MRHNEFIRIVSGADLRVEGLQKSVGVSLHHRATPSQLQDVNRRLILHSDIAES